MFTLLLAILSNKTSEAATKQDHTKINIAINKHNKTEYHWLSFQQNSPAILRVKYIHLYMQVWCEKHFNKDIKNCLWF